MNQDDEEFIAQFANLSAGSSPQLPISLADSEAQTRDCNICAMARVVSDRSVMEGGFTQTMMKAWGSHYNTEITTVARNIFLIQFVNAHELSRVMSRGIWTYRGDAVALRRVYGR
ncbi:hypothetical protein FCM35_KLT03911 [Carex littledalei]|uniref:DUF4283 domain-containing protein n=1 Tax=Carex littledalei TaxID=544730 RepID=A0A833R0N7_9POAL|nr:hypothetical protein FCM35_KLT03911 [Carex littledalei]